MLGCSTVAGHSVWMTSDQHGQLGRVEPDWLAGNMVHVCGPVTIESLSESVCLSICIKSRWNEVVPRNQLPSPC